jgi:hypothetical protein
VGSEGRHWTRVGSSGPRGAWVGRGEGVCGGQRGVCTCVRHSCPSSLSLTYGFTGRGRAALLCVWERWWWGKGERLARGEVDTGTPVGRGGKAKSRRCSVGSTQADAEEPQATYRPRTHPSTSRLTDLEVAGRHDGDADGGGGEGVGPRHQEGGRELEHLRLGGPGRLHVLRGAGRGRGLPCMSVCYLCVCVSAEHSAAVPRA